MIMGDTPTGRDAIEAAYDTLAGGGDEAGAASEEPISQAATEAGETTQEDRGDQPDAGAEPIGHARDEKGRFAPKPSDAPAKIATKAGKAPTVPPAERGPARAGGDRRPSPAGAATSPDQGALELDAEKPAAPAQPATKPPASWGPAAREHWATLPPEVQAETLRRDTEVTNTLREAAEAKRAHSAWREVYAPFEAHIRSAGVTPEQAAANLLQTEAGLRTGTPHQRADILARIIQTYGMGDESGLTAINRSLQQGPQAPAAQTSAPQQFRDPRFDVFLAQQEQQRLASFNAMVADLEAKSEFWGDVRADIADQVELAERRGVPITREFLEGAYKRACRSNDQVWDAMQKREATTKARAGTTSVARARAAGGSIRSSPAASNGTQAGAKGRDAVAAAYDELVGR